MLLLWLMFSQLPARISQNRENEDNPDPYSGIN